MGSRRAAIVAVIISACASGREDTTNPPSPDAATARCGDGLCEASEVGACGTDCGQPPASACGDGTCTAPETATSCPGDCGTVAACGDGTCQSPETVDTCPDDCTASSAMCGNAICETGETATCSIDCPAASTCPNGDDTGCFLCWFDPTTCVPPQTESVCGECLGVGCGDGDCDPGEENSCPGDCM